MNKPHKHAEVIRAWADGAEIQLRSLVHGQITWVDAQNPAWWDDYEYRVKPKKVKLKVRMYRTKGSYEVKSFTAGVTAGVLLLGPEEWLGDWVEFEVDAE